MGCLNNSVLLLSLVFLAFCLCSSAVDVSYDGRAIKIDGERKILISGSIHYPRSTPSMWPSLIKKSKDGGLNVIETYVFWNAHEPQRRQYDFTGNLDLVRFIKTIKEEGLYAFLRIGPYVCAEWNFGGFPVWLSNMPNIQLRTKNDVYMNEMQNFTTLIVDMMKREGLFASQGGPIILAQIENEYGNIMSSYGSEGKDYINWCAQMAESLDIGVPWVMCQQGDAPEPMINTCNGWYCDQFYPNNPNSPKIWTENWTGWFKGWGTKNPHRTAEDLAFAVARFFQLGGSMQNYYMYHGGTNFGRTSGGPFITPSYDYDAPLDEFGNLNQPKWGHLKQLHQVLRSMEKILTSGFRRDIDYGDNVFVTIYSYAGKSACFFGNVNDKEDITITFQNNNYTVPAWSVSILPDCYEEVYNTAKVNAQTSVMHKVLNKADDDEPYTLQWKWRSEHFEHLKNDSLVDKHIVLTTNKLLDQKAVTNDASDYLWYMTSVFLNESDPVWDKRITLHVHTSGHILHAFVNGKHVGSQWAQNGKYEFIFEKDVKMKIGMNTISLLSATAGLNNYGARYEKAEAGIHGPVKLIGIKSKEVKDLSANEWSYRVGLRGFEKELYQVSNSFQYHWHDNNLPVNKMFTWYKTTFPSPLGTDPVVVDLMGLGKGTVWVNGHNLGRYWPSYLADENGCSRTCNYRGSYSDKKCLTNCGKPTQRHYHIPRDFLREDADNLLVLFEEIGGEPMNVKLQTVVVGKICANAYNGHTLELSCDGDRVISRVKFASFGVPEGTCGSFKEGHCEAQGAISVVEKKCLGKERCTIDVNEQNLGPTGCKGATYRLAVEAVCSD